MKLADCGGMESNVQMCRYCWRLNCEYVAVNNTELEVTSQHKKKGLD